MAKTRRVIRKVNTPGQLVIDEQFWPVILALFVLCGFLMGTVAAYLPFDARHWWQDARTWLFVIPVFTCVVVWLLRYLPSQVVRRALQVSMVLCLVVHVLLLVLSLESRIFGRIQELMARNQPRRPQRELRIVNDYHSTQLEQHQRQQQEFVQPVETTVPEPETERVERQEERTEQPPVDPQPMPDPQTPREIQRNAIERPAPAETQPRQSEQASKLSRQAAEVRPKESEPISAPAAAMTAAAASTLEARSDSLHQSATELQASRSQSTPNPAASAASPVPALARRATERAPETETRSAPTLPRQLAQPTNTARVDVRTGETPSSARQRATSELEPARTTTRQQLTSSPNVSPVVDPSRDSSSTPLNNPARQREQPSPSQPQLAQTPVPVANRQPRTTTRPDSTSMAPTIAANAEPTAESVPNMDASASTVVRAESAARANPTAMGTTAPQGQASATNPILAQRAVTSAQPASASMAGPTPRVASSARAGNTPATVASPAQESGSEPAASLSLAGGSTGLPRQLSLMSAAGAAAGPVAPASPAATPSVPTTGERAQAAIGSVAEPAANAVNRVARSSRRSQVATSTTLAETPRTVTADAGGDQPIARPSRLAMTQSLGGIAGVGQTPNLDRSPSAPGSPSTTASGSARRAEATQNAPPGPALAPSATSLARRSLLGSDRPSASLRATTNSVADAAGSDRPAELNATSGATLTRQDANATQGATTAAKGTTDIDLGPTRVADAGGFERAAGGGQPEVNLDQDSATLTRTRSGGTAALALSSTAVDVSAAAPQGGDEPANQELAAGSAAMKPVPTDGVSGTAAVKNDLDPAPGASAGNTNQVAAAEGSRSVATADMPSAGDPDGGPAEETEEEKRRRLARAAMGQTGGGSVAGPVGTPGGSTSETEPSPGEAVTLAGPKASQGAPRQTATAGGSANGSTDQVAMNAPAGGGNRMGEATLRRAEMTDAVAGPALPGGGTAGPKRLASNREFATNVRAAEATLAGAPGSSGTTRGTDAAAQGSSPEPTATGAISRATKDPVGAAASDMARDTAPQSGTDVSAGIAQRSTVDGDSPQIGDAATSGAPIRRSGRTQLNAGPVIAAQPGLPNSPASLAVEDAKSDEAALGTGNSTARQQSAAALPVAVPAVDGPGGLGERLALDLGTQSRLATRDSIEVQTAPSRFLRQDIGGAPQLNTSAVFAADAFRSRAPSRGNTPTRRGTGSAGPQTEEAIELGLAYLAKRQLSDGSWTLRSTTEPVQLASDTAATGLCLLAFQGAGYSHREHRYATQVASGIEYLVKNQKPDGDLFVPLDDVSNRSVWLYSHGIAAIALCEAYGMTHDPTLREPAQKALDFIVAAQDPKGGGWRYQPGIESDTSVSGWMMMALKSGELAGLKVPRPTYDHIARWLDSAQGSDDERHLYRYNPFAPNTDTQRHGRDTSPTMTAVGLLMRLYGGWRRDHATMLAGAEHLRQNLPSIGTTREPLRDTYYWYYGTQVMFHMGGSLWGEWNGQLHPLLIESQIKQGESTGSWSPRSPVPDRWAPHAGRLYVTAMNLLSLEVIYRHLPLYVETGK